MALYHFSAKVISRAAGSSAVAAAAYRSASRLHDQRLDRRYDFSNKAGVVHSEVMLPDGAPQELGDTGASGEPAWKSLPSWFVYGNADQCIPAATHSFMAHRAGAKQTLVIKGASHSVMVSHPAEVAAFIERAAISAASASPAGR